MLALNGIFELVRSCRRAVVCPQLFESASAGRSAATLPPWRAFKSPCTAWNAPAFTSAPPAAKSPRTESAFPFPHWQVTKHGLEYPHFYRRLYGLLTPEAFHVSWSVPVFLPLSVTWPSATTFCCLAPWPPAWDLLLALVLLSRACPTAAAPLQMELAASQPPTMVSQAHSPCHITGATLPRRPSTAPASGPWPTRSSPLAWSQPTLPPRL